MEADSHNVSGVTKEGEINMETSASKQPLGRHSLVHSQSSDDTNGEPALDLSDASTNRNFTVNKGNQSDSPSCTMQKKDNGNTELSIVIDACIVTEHVTKVLIPEKVSSLHMCQYEYVKCKFLEVKKHKEEELLKAQQLAREEGIKLAKKCIASEMGCDEKELDDLDLSELNEFSFDDNEPLTSSKKIKLENETSAGTPQYVATLKKT